MDIVAIEGDAFEQMKHRFERFTKQVRELCKEDDSEEKWLDNQDVCQILQISKRTLQAYRDNGTLPYSQIGHKCYYKTTDVEQLIRNSLKNKSK